MCFSKGLAIMVVALDHSKNFIERLLCIYNRANARQNLQNGMCSQQNSDQPGHPPSLISPCYPHEESLGP